LQNPDREVSVYDHVRSSGGLKCEHRTHPCEVSYHPWCST
jgi:hypothetical protein